MIGTTISHYRIIEKLGEGGMGVVYKAKDTKLDREVALKFLPNDFTISDEEHTRFVHEAKSVSALDHPNICTIYDIDTTPDGQMFIALGYYEGMSLSRKLEDGKLEMREAITIATQIAEGLKAAHEKGIVHRDMKSSNIIITNEGQAKILDFGLAQKSGLTKLTRTGSTLGTASYMSPEQVRREKIDERSDLWSLGVVLYEMVTGKLPFVGDNEAVILYSVVNEEPQPLEAPPELVHVIRRALEKDPTERYTSAGEMLADLRRMKNDTIRTAYRPMRVSWKKTRNRKRLLAALLVPIVGVAVYTLFFREPTTVINPDWEHRALQIPLHQPGLPGISGDGNWIGFSAIDPQGDWGLYLMNAEGGKPIFNTRLTSDTWVDVSRDGGLIVYAFMEGLLYNAYVTYSTGGTPRKITENGCLSPRFSPDGQRVGYIRGLPPGTSDSLTGKLEFWSVGINGMDPRLEFIDSISFTGRVSFSYSPDGRKVAWLRTFQAGYEEIIIYDLETDHEQQITSDGKQINDLMWVHEDKILYTTDRGGIMNIWMVSAVGGTPVQITNLPEPVYGVKASVDGQKIIYVTSKPVADLWIVNIPEDRWQQITFTDESHSAPNLSPDGKKIALILRGHLFVMNRDGSSRRQLSFGDEEVRGISWSLDSRMIAYGSRHLSEPADSFRTYIIDPLEPGTPRYIGQGYVNHRMPWIDSLRIEVIRGSACFLLSIDGASPVRLSHDFTWANVLRGGKYTIFGGFEWLDKGEVGFTDGIKSPNELKKGARLIPGIKGIRTLRPSPDGKWLFALRGSNDIWKMSLPDGAWERVNASFTGVTSPDNFYLGWDGNEMIIRKVRQSSKMVMIENLFQ